MQKYIIEASLTEEQVSYLRQLAAQNNINFTLFVAESSETSSAPATRTTITAEMLSAVASNMGKTVLEVAALAAQYNIETLEDALAHNEIPTSVKEVLEQFV